MGWAPKRASELNSPRSIRFQGLVEVGHAQPCAWRGGTRAPRRRDAGALATWPWWGWLPAPLQAHHLTSWALEGARGGVTLIGVVHTSHLSEGGTLTPTSTLDKSPKTRFGLQLELDSLPWGAEHIPIISSTCWTGMTRVGGPKKHVAQRGGPWSLQMGPSSHGGQGVGLTTSTRGFSTWHPPWTC